MATVLRIVQVRGPRDPLVASESTFDRDTEIGRSMETAWCLPDPTVSRQHATLLIRQGLWYLVDQDSTTGTFVNNQRLVPREPAQIRPGDAIGIGPWVFRVAGDKTITRTIDLSEQDGGELLDEPISSRRLDALGEYLGGLGRQRSPEDLARRTIEAALTGTGFRRGAVLAVGGLDEGPAFVAGRVRGADGSWQDLSAEGFRPSSRLLGRAMEGRAAVFSAHDTAQPVDHAHSLLDEAIAAAMCVPVVREGGVEALIYLDSRGGSARVDDALEFCADVAAVFSFALTERAHTELAQRQHAMRVEFEHAKELRSMLTSPPTKDDGVFIAAHRSLAGMFVSADFFDTITHDDGRMQVVFGDASGHGIGASILSTLVHAHLIALLRSGVEIADAVRATNRFIAEKATAGRFVSLVVAELTPDGSMRIVDAGHGHWVHLHDGSAYHPRAAASVPVGIDPDAAFAVESRPLAPGDRLVLYTDGVSEQPDEGGEEFGYARLEAVINAADSSRADVRGVFEALLAHAGTRAIEDDATVASVEMRA